MSIRTIRAEQRARKAEERAREAEKKREEAIQANKGWSNAYRELEKENSILKKALNTLQRAFDKAEDVMKRVFGWYEFKDRFRTAEPEFYHDFQATRQDPSLYGTESKQEQEQRQRYFSLDR